MRTLDDRPVTSMVCKCPMHAHGSAECYCFCLHDGSDLADRTEQWLPIPGLEDRYLVSDYGRVFSLQRQRVLKGWVNETGYPSVGLFTGPGGETLTRTVHGLVLRAFVGPRPDGLVTRHLDGNPANNWLGNLVYGTNTENALDALSHGRNPYASQTHCKHGHEFTDENTYWSVRRTNGRRRRHCKECNRLLCAVQRERRRALRDNEQLAASVRAGDPF